MKKVLSLVLAMALMLSFLPTVQAAEADEAIDTLTQLGIMTVSNDIPVYLDGEQLPQNGMIAADRTYLPVRALCEALGMEVDWVNDTRSVILGTAPETTEKTDAVNIYLDGVKMENAEAIIANDFTYLPVRALCEALGMNVEWNNDTREVYVTTPNTDPLNGKYFELVHASTNLYLAVENAGTDNGAKIVVAKSSDNVHNQTWGFTSMGNGYYKVVNRATGKSIDIGAHSTIPGVELTQYTYNGGDNQIVKAILNEDGTYTFTFKHSDLAITATERYTTQEEFTGNETQRFSLNYVGITPMGELLKSEGYKALDEATRERFSTYVFTTLPFGSKVLPKVESKLLESDYFNLSAEEQANILRECLKIVPYDLVYTGEVYAEVKNAEFEITNKTYQDSYDVWRGTMLPVWMYSVKMEGDVEGQVHEWTMISTVEDSSVVTDAIEAMSRFPYAMRKFVNRVIYREDSANNYNGGGDTIWIRLNFIPSANSIAQTFAHELGHILDTNTTSDYTLWDNSKAADVVPISGYGNNNRAEDLAEFSRLYHMVKSIGGGLENLEKVYPNRFMAYAALLYASDSEYYANYKSYYEKAMSFDDDNEPAYYCTISLPGTNLVLTATDASTTGSTVTFEENTGADNQIWRIRTWQGKKAIFNKASGLCINVPGNSTDSGKNLIVWNGGKGTNELMTMTQVSGNTYTFAFAHSNLYLGSESTKAGCKAIQTDNKTSVVVTRVE